MLYLESTGISYSRDDIETDGSVYAEVLDVGIGRHDNTAYFLPVHRFLRFGVIRITAGFHFHYDQFFILCLLYTSPSPRDRG